MFIMQILMISNTLFLWKGLMDIFRELAKSVREYKRLSLITPILITLEVVLECIIPFITASMVNQIKRGSDFSTIFKYGFILIVLSLLSLVFGWIAGTTSATAACGFAKNLRKDMFYSIQNYSFENIDRFSSSSLITRMTTDVTNVQNAYMMLIRTAIRAPLMLIFAFAMAFVLGGRMAWIFFVVNPDTCNRSGDCNFQGISPVPEGI